MKKLLILLLVSVSLISCGGKKFSDLPKEEQNKITAQIQADILPIAMKEVFPLAMKGTSDKEIKEKMKKILKDYVKKELQPKYPGVDFSDLINKGLNKDNSRNESKKEEKQEKPKKIYKQIKLGEFAILTGSNHKGKLKIKVSDIVWKGKKFEQGYIVYTANNEWLAIKLEAENIGKKPTFKELNYSTKLITKDGTEYEPDNTLQIEKPKEGYSGCIECKNNPGNKAEQYILFDIKKINLAGAKLRFDEDLVDFNL